MFKSKAPALSPSIDYTGTLRETSFYKYGHLRTLGLSGEVTALAVDPILSLLAVGTSVGMVHVFGNNAFQFALPVSSTLPDVGRKPDGIKFLVFHPGHNRLVVIDKGNTIHTFALNNISDSATPNVSPPLPIREAFLTVFGEITAVEQPLPSHTHMFFTMRDGVTLAWDLRQLGISNFQIVNLWALHEERLVRSGVPGRQKTIEGQKATCIAMNPRDLNILLIGYEGGVVAWDFQNGAVAKVFEMTLPPGAPGGGSYLDDKLWTERTPHVTSIAWRPDGLAFAVGHDDGCIAIWAYADADKPIMVRTLTHEDVNVTDAESLVAAGALDGQAKSDAATHDIEGMPVLPDTAKTSREPIFKLAWAGFPDQANLRTLASQVDGVPVSNATAEYSERGETILVVLGGQSPTERPGINMLQFPAYQPPLNTAQGARRPSRPTEGLSAAERSSYRDSLAPTGSSNYPTKTPPEDFFLLPRTSPYFGMAHDAVAIFILLTPDPKLPVPSTPTAQNHLDAYAFPPPRSSIAPPPLGRKTYQTPGDGENTVAMTPAPMLGSAAGPGRSTSSSSWRFPWTATTTSSNASIASRVSSPTSLLSPKPHLPNFRRRLRTPAQIWSGGLSVLGCRIISVPTPTFKQLIAPALDPNNDHHPRVPLRGGLAVPDLQSQGAPDLKVVKMENYRLLVTWHADATVRFWDASPHILVLPTPLMFEYPSPLPHLTISIGEYLRHRDVAHLPIAKLWATDRSKVKIAGVFLARESLECIITFATGEVIVTKYAEGTAPPSPPEDDDLDEPVSARTEFFAPSTPTTPIDPEYTEEITEIQHLAKWSQDGFKPIAIFTVRRGAAIKCAVTDIGFIAVAYESNSLAVFDMRGPDIILREGFDEEGKTVKKRKRKGTVNFAGENSRIGALKWTISGLGGDTAPRPRLVVSYDKGVTKIYNLVNTLGEWMVESKPPTFSNESLANPLATFVLDVTSGNELFASPEALASLLENEPTSDGKWSKEAPPHCLWIAASKKAIRCSVNFNGERVNKVEFDQDELSDVHYVTRHGHRVIVALTTSGSAIFYTAPQLEYITRMDLFFGGTTRPVGMLSFDDRSGDFIEYNGPLDITLRTVFNFRKPFPPRIDPCSFKHPTPAQPLPLTASYFGWMWGGAPLTGAGLDAIIGGPNRPQPPKPPPAPRKPLITWGAVPEEPKLTSTPTPLAPKRTAATKQRPPRADARERTDAYSEVKDSLNKRGDALDVLGDSLTAASNTATSYFNAARKAVAKETAKGMFGKYLP